MLNVWLSRWHDGYYSVSFYKPIRSKIKGTGTAAFYFQEGDPIGHRYICEAAATKIFRDDPRVINMMPMDEPLKVVMDGWIVETNE
jgi:hypothetical protein